MSISDTSECVNIVYGQRSPQFGRVLLQRTSKFWKDKRKQTSLTLKWLSENYTICEGVCLPRCILYSHYLDFCRQENIEPACAATFGKVPLLRHRNPRVEPILSVSFLEQRSHEVETFGMMYKTHCQCILDMVIGDNFDEVRVFLLHFWQGIPEHLLHLVHIPAIVDLVCVCDSVLYKVLKDVLIPPTIQDMPEHLLRDVRKLARTYEGWVLTALDNLPAELIASKVRVLRRFTRSLRRHASFLHIAQTVRPMLKDHKKIIQMLDGVRRIMTSYYGRDNSEHHCEESIPCQFLCRLGALLDHDVTPEVLVEWLDDVIQRMDIKRGKQNEIPFQKFAQDFLLQWSYVGTKILHSLTLHYAPSFASFHIVRLLIDEYVFLAIETKLHQYEEDAELTTFRSRLKSGDTIRTSIHATPGTCFIANKATRKHNAGGRNTSTKDRPSSLAPLGCLGARTSVVTDINDHRDFHLSTRVANDKGQLPTPPISPPMRNNIPPRPNTIDQSFLHCHDSGRQPGSYLGGPHKIHHRHQYVSPDRSRTNAQHPHRGQFFPCDRHMHVDLPDIHSSRFFQTRSYREWMPYDATNSTYLQATQYPDYYSISAHDPRIMKPFSKHHPLKPPDEATPSQPPCHTEATDPLNILDQPRFLKNPCTYANCNSTACGIPSGIYRYDACANQDEYMAMSRNAVIAPSSHFQQIALHCDESETLPSINTVFMS